MLLERTRIGRQMRLFAGRVHTFEVEPLVQALREEQDYRDYGRDGVTLVKTPDLRMVLEVLQGGMWLEGHREPGTLTLQVVSGELRFQTGEDVLYLRAGEILAMPTAEPYSLEAVTESAFLLTIGPAADRLPSPSPDGAASEPCDAEDVGRLVRQIRRDWPAAQQRFMAEWPGEAEPGQD